LTLIEVLNASSVEDGGDELVAAHIDGTEGIQDGFSIVGWVLARETAVSGVEVVHGQRVVGEAGLGAPRPDAALAHPEAPEARNSGFRVPVKSDELPNEFELFVQAVLEGERRVPIGSLRARKTLHFKEIVGGHIDGLHQNPKKVIVIGWALAGSTPVSHVEVLHADAVVARAELGEPREDVASVHPTIEGAGSCGFQASIDAAELPDAYELQAVAVLADRRRVSLGSVRGGKSPVPAYEPSVAMPEHPSIKRKLRDLILRAGVSRHAIELPPPDGVGSVHEPLTTPPWKARAALLDQVDLGGKHVLDLGSDLGQLSRAARARGAALVDGFESDPERITLARLLNAYYDATRISFYSRDLADPASYTGSYDVVLALGVLERLGPALESVVRVTGGILVADPAGAEQAAALRERLPHWQALGQGETGADGENAFVFAADPGSLRSALKAAATFDEAAAS
jgi:hypothetical protein